MRIYRLYTGNDGQSHLEELKIPFASEGTGEQSPMHKAHGAVFSRVAPGTFSDWHNAPRRQFAVVLQGTMEIGLGDDPLHRIRSRRRHPRRRPDRQGPYDASRGQRAADYDRDSARGLTRPQMHLLQLARIAFVWKRALPYF